MVETIYDKMMMRPEYRTISFAAEYNGLIQGKERKWWELFIQGFLYCCLFCYNLLLRYSSSGEID
jgi:hypothetical protein